MHSQVIDGLVPCVGNDRVVSMGSGVGVMGIWGPPLRRRGKRLSEVTASSGWGSQLLKESHGEGKHRVTLDTGMRTFPLESVSRWLLFGAGHGPKRHSETLCLMAKTLCSQEIN